MSVCNSTLKPGNKFPLLFILTSFYSGPHFNASNGDGFEQEFCFPAQTLSPLQTVFLPVGALQDGVMDTEDRKRKREHSQVNLKTRRCFNIVEGA